MNYTILIATLLFVLVPREQKLPDEFYKIPEPVRSEATIVLTGTYGRARSPCIFRPDGSRMWVLESRFDITKVYRGKVGGKSVYINKAMLPRSEYVGAKLATGHDYLVLLRPNEESLKAIEAGDHVPAWDALRDDEIVAIIELK